MLSSLVDFFPYKKPLCYVLPVLDDIDLSATLQAPVKRNSKSTVTRHRNMACYSDMDLVSIN